MSDRLFVRVPALQIQRVHIYYSVKRKTDPTLHLPSTLSRKLSVSRTPTRARLSSQTGQASRSAERTAIQREKDATRACASRTGPARFRDAPCSSIPRLLARRAKTPVVPQPLQPSQPTTPMRPAALPAQVLEPGWQRGRCSRNRGGFLLRIRATCPGLGTHKMRWRERKARCSERARRQRPGTPARTSHWSAGTARTERSSMRSRTWCTRPPGCCTF